MAPQVRKVKSAFLYYQGEMLKSVRDELGISMGEAMTEVRNRSFCCVVLAFEDIFHALTRLSLRNETSWLVVGGS